jgi:hypothetical protein
MYPKNSKAERYSIPRDLVIPFVNSGLASIDITGGMQL